MRALVFAILSLSACAPPLVLVDDAFLGDHRTVKIVLQRAPSGNFDQYVRVCDVAPDGSESRCQDTLILTDVEPSSVY